MKTLVTVAELARQLDNPLWLVADCRFSLTDVCAGYKAWLDTHIPGAFHADVNLHLSAAHIPGITGRHPLPDQEQWRQQVQNWGITPTRQVVVYDDAGGAFAARMWWMLRWLGHENVAVLDGGWQAWNKQGLPVSTQLSTPAVNTKEMCGVRTPLTRLISADAIDGSKHLLLDARELPRFRGESETIDPVAGHIPGARCSPFSANLDAQGCFKTGAALREKFAAAGVTTDERDLVCYCGSGLTATHNILALKLAGFEEPLLYAGSWSDWITDPHRPRASGDD
ncbi:MAG: sulfurtransferase [Pseudomonadales bacterium]|nr:sulfurtransferase [Pseudomonadales bacterium]